MLIEELQFTCCGDVEQDCLSLTASAPGDFASVFVWQAATQTWTLVNGQHLDLLDGEDRQVPIETDRSHARSCTQTNTEWSKFNYSEPQGSI